MLVRVRPRGGAAQRAVHAVCRAHERVGSKGVVDTVQLERPLVAVVCERRDTVAEDERGAVHRCGAAEPLCELARAAVLADQQRRVSVAAVAPQHRSGACERGVGALIAAPRHADAVEQRVLEARVEASVRDHRGDRRIWRVWRRWRAVWRRRDALEEAHEAALVRK